MNAHVLRIFLVASFFLCLPATGQTQSVDGNARIRLSGEVSPARPDRIRVRQIEEIGLRELEAFNPYEKQSDRYTGVWLDEFVAYFAAPGVNRIRLSAIDDYSVEFAAAEWSGLRILLVTRVNGEYIGFDRKGPMRIVFADYDPTMKVYKENMAKWMWMINKVEFKIVP